MNEKTDTEFIEHIKNVLQSHEEPYKKGSWEIFAAHSLPKTPAIIKKRSTAYWLAAASLLLLLGAGTFLLIYNNSKQSLQTAAIKHPLQTVLPVDANIVNDSNIYVSANNNLADHALAEEKNFIEKTLLINKIIDKVFLSKENNTTTTNIVPNILSDTKKTAFLAPHTSGRNIIEPDKQPAKNINNTATQNHEKQQIQPAYTEKNIYVYNNSVLENEDKIFKKWKISAEVASSMGNTKKVNMSYGLNIGYALNDKLSIHSGASFAQLNSAIDKAQAGGSANLYASEASIKNDLMMISNAAAEPTVYSSEIRLAGVEIPVEMRYYFGKKIYTNIGVSAMALVESKQINTYITESNRPVGFARSADADITSTNAIEEKKVESFSGAGVLKNNFIEFFNMSLGYKQPITDKRNIRIEPFVKIPIGNNGNVKVPLSNVGVKVGLEL